MTDLASLEGRVVQQERGRWGMAVARSLLDMGHQGE
jgi:hypothetical protein